MRSDMEKTDEEIICNFMQAKPEVAEEDVFCSEVGCLVSYEWWQLFRARSGAYWNPIHLTLDKLHEVEERLTEEQCCAYDRILDGMTKRDAHSSDGPSADVFPWHATAEQRRKALASVLKGAC